MKNGELSCQQFFFFGEGRGHALQQEISWLPDDSCKALEMPREPNVHINNKQDLRPHNVSYSSMGPEYAHLQGQEFFWDNCHVCHACHFCHSFHFCHNCHIVLKRGRRRSNCNFGAKIIYFWLPESRRRWGRRRRSTCRSRCARTGTRYR